MAPNDLRAASIACDVGPKYADNAMNMARTGYSAPPTLQLAQRHGTMRRRVIGASAALAAATVLGIAAWLHPSERGIGTHQQMMAAPCGWIANFDLPCPTCGMTTAFAHAADGNLVASFLAQPAGFALALLTAATLLLGASVAVTGSDVSGALRRLWGPRTAWGIASAVAAAWVYKILSYKGVV